MAGSTTRSTLSTSSSEAAVSPVGSGSSSNLLVGKEEEVVGNEYTTSSRSQAKHIGTQFCQTGKIFKFCLNLLCDCIEKILVTSLLLKSYLDYIGTFISFTVLDSPT